MKRMPWSISSYTNKSKSPFPNSRRVMSEGPPDKFKMIPSQVPYPMTDPLPSCYRPPSPPTTLSTQMTMYRHYQYIDYYKQQQLLHQEEIKKFEALQMADMSSTYPLCYIRNFPSPMSLTPPGSLQDKFIFPEIVYSSKDVKPEDRMKMEVKETVGRLHEDALGTLLAELREGTMAMDV